MKGGLYKGYGLRIVFSKVVDSDFGSLRGLIMAEPEVGALTSFAGSVWIGLLFHDIVYICFKVVKGIPRVTTVTTLGALLSPRTVDELLLREGQEFSRCSKVGALEGSNSGEGPA